MSDFITSLADFDPSAVYAVALGGQAEMGLVLWLFIHQGQILIVDAGASYPATELPGVDLFLPNTNFLEANQDKIAGLILTNGHEEHCGAVSYLLSHVKVPRVMAPPFVATLIRDNTYDLYGDSSGAGKGGQALPELEQIETRKQYKVGPFGLEWIDCNNAIADSCALKISTGCGNIVYTSSFKLDQTPVDGNLLDVGRLAAIGDDGVELLISDSANVEEQGYTPSEKKLAQKFNSLSKNSRGRLIVVAPATNTHRLKILVEAARLGNRRVILIGDTLHKVAVAAAMTGHLPFDQKNSASLSDLTKLSDEQVFVIASSIEADPINTLDQLATGTHPQFALKDGDTLVFSSDVMPGHARHMGIILDELLTRNVKCIWGTRQGVHVSKHASREELKMIVATVKPHYFVPAIGEGRHITQHGELSEDVGLQSDQVFCLANGDVFELSGGFASVMGNIESQPVLFNREQGERVTTASVNERRALSLEGVMTIGLSVTAGGDIESGPTFECGASGFLRSPEWTALSAELEGIIREAVEKSKLEARKGAGTDPAGLAGADGLSVMRSAIRESVVKTFRSRLAAKPTVQVLLSRASS